MRAIPTLKISISGVRGVIGESLTPSLLTRFAQAFGTYVGPGTIVIGRDPRTSGEMVKQAVVAGLLSSGSRILDIGMCPVPTVQLMVRRQQAVGGIAITASHNPAEWNALKFIGADGLFLSSDRAREMLDIYHQGEYTKVSGSEMRQVDELFGATDIHIQTILEALGPLPPLERKLRVVLDSCNGAASLAAPKFKKLSLELGGKNPAIVSRNANLEDAATGIVRSAFGLQGQKCSAASRVIVEEPVYDELLGKLKSKTESLAIGDPTERATYLGPVINQGSYNDFKNFTEEINGAGGQFLTGGHVKTGGIYDKGYFVEPTFVTDLPYDHRLWQY